MDSGLFTVEISKKWQLTIAPYYNKMLKMLKWVLPVLQPAAGTLLDEATLKAMDPSLGLIKDYANKLPEIEADQMAFPDEGLHSASGSELRMIRQILGKKDTSHHWGGLERVVTPEGHILWLCKKHAKEYK